MTRAHKGWALDSVTIHNEVLRQSKEEIVAPPAVGDRDSARAGAEVRVLPKGDLCMHQSSPLALQPGIYLICNQNKHGNPFLYIYTVLARKRSSVTAVAAWGMGECQGPSRDKQDRQA